MDWLRYANQGATRNQPLAPELVSALSFLPELGVSMEVFSGGQPAKGTSTQRVGSTRHDHGNAADVFFHQNGRRLNWAQQADVPIFQDIVRRAREAGVTGFGAGPGYMREGSMHIGMGSPGVWGAGGSGANAPDWLRAAYGGGPAPAPAAGPTRQAAATARALNPAPMAEQAGIQPGQAAPAVFGDLVAPQAVQTFAVPAAPDFGSYVAQLQEERRVREVADHRRRVALFSADLFS